MGIKALILLNNDLIDKKVKRGEDPDAGPPSPFCKALNLIAQMDGDEMYMTTGFHSAYSFTDLGENFSNNIIKGFNKYSNANLRLLAGSYTNQYGKKIEDCVDLKCTCGDKGTNTYECQPKKYRNFYQKIKDNLKTSKNTKITPHIFERWHTKVTFKTKETSFVAMLIGSSNISSRALTRIKTSNTECDIFLYDKDYDSMVKKELSSELGKTAFSLDVSGVLQLGRVIQNKPDGSSVLRFLDSGGLNSNIPESEKLIFLINEGINNVLECYYQLAKPMNLDEGN